MTTSAKTPGILAEGINVEKMNTQEGVLLLLRRAKILVKEAPLAQALEQIVLPPKALSAPWMVCPLPLTRPEPLWRKHSVACQLTSPAIGTAGQNSCSGEEGQAKSAQSLLPPPGLSQQAFVDLKLPFKQ